MCQNETVAIIQTEILNIGFCLAKSDNRSCKQMILCRLFQFHNLSNVHGSWGLQFPPFKAFDDSSKMYLFVPDMFRTVEMGYQKDVTFELNDIPLKRYAPSDKFWEGEDKNPDNKQFHMDKGDFMFYAGGFHFNAPIYLSKHCFGGRKDLREKIPGMPCVPAEKKVVSNSNVKLSASDVSEFETSEIAYIRRRRLRQKDDDAKDNIEDSDFDPDTDPAFYFDIEPYRPFLTNLEGD